MSSPVSRGSGPASAKVMTLRLPSDQAEQLEAIARAEDVSVSEAVRIAIMRDVEARRNDPDFQQRLQRRLEEDRQILERLANS
jgi:hypothetical protein